MAAGYDGPIGATVRTLAAGAACGLRTFSGPAALHRSAPLAALAVGELVADKAPMMPSRLRAGGLGARALTGGWSGARLAGPRGAVLGIAAAMTSAQVGARGRAMLVSRTGWPDAGLAVAEDALAYGLALGVARGARR